MVLACRTCCASQAGGGNICGTGAGMRMIKLEADKKKIKSFVSGTGYDVINTGEQKWEMKELRKEGNGSRGVQANISRETREGKQLFAL